jgi:hypothetical protein
MKYETLLFLYYEQASYKPNVMVFYLSCRDPYQQIDYYIVSSTKVYLQYMHIAIIILI